MFESINLAILIASGLVVASILTSLVSFRVGAPLLLLFLLLGLGAGEDGPGQIEFDDAHSAYFIGSLALAIILFDSGFATRLQSFRIAAAPALVLATVGVVLTAAGVGAAARYLLQLTWPEAMLLGAIVSSTDAAAVFFLLRVGGIRLRDRIRATLEIESGSNDPMAIFLTISLVELIASEASTQEMTWALAERFALQIGLGGALGVLGGLAIVQVVNRISLEQALYPIVVLALALCLFAAVNMTGGSGFLGVYVAGVVAGNARIRYGTALRRFQGGTTWLSQIAMFLTLGLLATPSEFPQVMAPAIGVALVLILLARPFAVWLCLLPFGFRRNETGFAAWVGLRGAVSILLAILPLTAGLPNGQLFFNTAFVIVLTSLLVQGWTIRPMARWLGLIVPARTGPLERQELELPGGGVHEIVAYRVLAESPVGRGERIPRWARPSLIVREGRSMKLHGAGHLRPGDQVYIITLPHHVPLLDRLFAGPAGVDPTDRQFYGDFVLAPDAPIADVAANYGFELRPEDKDRTVTEVLNQELGAGAEAGDRLAYGPVELIVRSTTEEHRIEAVGLAVEQAAAPRTRLPLFHSRKDIAALLRRWRARRRPGSVAAPAAEPPVQPSGADGSPAAEPDAPDR